MLTISAFIFVAGSVLTSVWWACRSELASPPAGLATSSPDDSQAPISG
jgi:hypothetical protein